MIKVNGNPRMGITVVGILALVFGIGEIIVGFTGNYVGILSQSIVPAVSTVIIGSLYSLGGLCLLTIRKWGASLGIVFIGGEILGRIYLVTVGIAPYNGPDAIKIAVGGAIAFAMIIYVLSQWNEFE